MLGVGMGCAPIVTTSGLSAPKLLRGRFIAAVGLDSACLGDSGQEGGVCVHVLALHEDGFISYQAILTAPSLPRPARHGGGVYTTPKFSCTQYGQAAGSETRWVGFGSARLIWTKHSVHMA